LDSSLCCSFCIRDHSR